MSTLFFDIEVAFYPEVTRLALEKGVDERKFTPGKFGSKIEASLRYVSHISFKRDHGKVINLFVGDRRGAVNEKQILQTFSKVWNDSDEVVAFYGEGFDRKFLNSRIEKYKLPMLKPVRLVDPWKILVKNFLLADNKLDTAIKFFKCPYEKPALPWSVWQKVSLGVERAIETLRHRCKYDVLSMAWLWYNHLQKYAPDRVNRALAYEYLYIDDEAVSGQLGELLCPRCSLKGKFWRRGYKYNKTTTLMALQCQQIKCREWMHATIKKDGTIGRIR